MGARVYAVTGKLGKDEVAQLLTVIAGSPGSAKSDPTGIGGAGRGWPPAAGDGS